MSGTRCRPEPRIRGGTEAAARAVHGKPPQPERHRRQSPGAKPRTARHSTGRSSPPWGPRSRRDRFPRVEFPFCLLHGRTDGMIFFYGANVTLDQVRTALEHPDLAPHYNGNFLLGQGTSPEGDPVIEVTLEDTPANRAADLTQVLDELPARTEITLHVDLSPDERALYEALRRRAIETVEAGPGPQARIRILAELMRLRRACCHPRLALDDPAAAGVTSSKLEAFGELLDELLENHHKALVFSQFVDHLAVVRDYLASRRVAYQYLDGSTSMEERKRRVAAFQAGEGDVFLISLRAGGTDHSWTTASPRPTQRTATPWWGRARSPASPWPSSRTSPRSSTCREASGSPSARIAPRSRPWTPRRGTPHL